MSDAPYPMSPTLAVALDLWGSTVAHRVATVAQPRWYVLPSPRAKRLTPAKHSRRVKDLEHAHRSDNHGGLKLTSFELAQNWPRIVKIERSFPSNPEFSLATRRMLMELAGHGKGEKGKPGDVRAVQAAYLTITMLLVGRSRWAGASRDMRSLVAWLFAVPKYSGLETDVLTWCEQRYRGATSESIEKIAMAREHQVRQWLARANHHVRSIFEGDDWLEGDLWLSAEAADRLAAGASPEILEPMDATVRRYCRLVIETYALLRYWPQEEEDDPDLQQAS